MTAPKARRKTARKPTEADLRKPLVGETDHFYDRTKPQPIGGHGRGLFAYTDGPGGDVVFMGHREITAEDPKKDLRQTDLDTIYAAKKERWEQARRPGVAIPLPDDFTCTEDPTNDQ